ncbi:MAG: hypothetical protein EBS68_10350 [Rhodobacteraceae bacterium]|nr:hypothetical protein [Paracoccaceae bacterium]
MAAILPAVNIESEKAQASFFLPYQLRWIKDRARKRIWEKSVRIGATFADAFSACSDRILFAKRNYLFQTKDLRSAIEYMETCMQFAEVFNFTRSIVSHGMDEMTVEGVDEAGKKFTQDVKFGVIKFDNGSRILAFSSNPLAMAVYEGDVGLDEYAKAVNAEKLWETAQGRIRMGYRIAAWSAHNGTDTLFYQFVREAAAGKGEWSHHKTTIVDAVNDGLVERINSWRGTTFTRGSYIAAAKSDAILPEIYEQTYMCNPQGSTSAIVGWNYIVACQRSYRIPRAHFEHSQVVAMFGEATSTTKLSRAARIEGFIREHFAPLFAENKHHALGFDVAASGHGDLASIWIDTKYGTERRLSGLFTCRTEDWDFLEAVVAAFMRGVPSITGRGDETGLGKQICWNMARDFRDRFEGVNFSASKSDIFTLLMGQLASAEKVMPSHIEDGHDVYADVHQDIFGMRKATIGGRLVFSCTKNVLNPVSHGDIACSAALASDAGRNEAKEMTASSNKADGASRGMFGGRGHQPISGGRLAGV